MQHSVSKKSKPGYKKGIIDKIGRIILLILVLHAPALMARDDAVARRMHSDYYTRNFNDTTLTLAQRLAYSDSLLAVGSAPQPWPFYLKRQRMLMQAGRAAEVGQMYRQLLPKIPADSLRMQYGAMWELGKYSFDAGQYGDALQIAYDILAREKEPQYLHYDVKALVFLVNFYSLARDYTTARQYQQEALALLTQISAIESDGFSDRQVGQYQALFHWLGAGMYLEEGDTQHAFAEVEEAKKVFQSPYANMANAFLTAQIAAQKGEVKMAEDYYRDALAHPDGSHNKDLSAIKLMTLLLDQNRLDDVAQLLDTHPEIFTTLAGSPNEAEYLRSLARYHNLRGDRAAEADCLARVAQIADSLSLALASANAGSLRDNYLRTIYRRQVERENSRMLLLGVLGAFFLVAAGVFGVLWWRTRKRLRAARTAMQTSEHQHDESMRSTADSLVMRNQELVSMTLHMARLNKALAEISATAANGKEDAEARLRAIQTAVGDVEREENLWEMFRTYFDGVHQSFFDRLAKAHPNLTNAEQRMCAFLLIGLTTKEIAILTNRSPRTVEVIRFNLRKKLATTLPTDQYLRTL